MSTFIDQKIEQYIEDHTSNESEILKNLERKLFSVFAIVIDSDTSRLT